MDRIFGDLPLCFMYLANILVFSSSFEDYQLNLLRVLDPCLLTINLEKYVFNTIQLI